jgi:uncharacterized protein
MRCTRPYRAVIWRPWALVTARPRPNPPRPHHERRNFTLSTLTAILTPPAVFGGLVITLWTYKCVMMVVFQNKIIYMPGIPPFARSEKVSDYANQCRPVEWQDHSTKSADGTTIKLLEGAIPKEEAQKNLIVLYLQGNAASTPPRLPYLSSILKQVDATAAADIRHTIIALSYRGFWTSKGRPSQRGIELDAAAALRWIFERYSIENTSIVVWGQSIGAGVATTALANLLASKPDKQRLTSITGLLLETPFIDMSTMLVALYPQKFLPYRYLTPFLESSWDSRAALTTVAQDKQINPRILILQAGDDEIVPADHAGVLQKICQDGGLETKHKVVTGALHTEIMAKAQGRVLIANFLASM